jgi:quercetin dioxygenase-like cupin family protein
MTDPEQYFAKETTSQSHSKGSWVQWDALQPIEMVPGLEFQPVVGAKLMVNFVSFAPDTVAPVHWHDEEQISVVLEGELEFEVGGETRVMRAGEAVVIPPNVPHGARTYDVSCLSVDAFHPPRQGVVDAMS